MLVLSTYSTIFQLNGAKVWSVVPFSSLVEHFMVMFVGLVELSRAQFSRMEEKSTKKRRAKVCLDCTGVSGLPFCMFCTKSHVSLCFRA